MFSLVQWIERHTHIYDSIETAIIEIHGKILEHRTKNGGH